MAKQIGADRLGDFYKEGSRVRKRREWRGFRDTMYDYSRWLWIMMTLGKFVAKPRNVKEMPDSFGSSPRCVKAAEVCVKRTTAALFIYSSFISKV